MPNSASGLPAGLGPTTNPEPEVAFLRALVPEPRLRLASSLVLQSGEAVTFEPTQPAPEALVGFCRAVISGAGLDPAALPDPLALPKLARGRLLVAFDHQCHSALIANDIWIVRRSNGTQALLYEVIQPNDTPTRAEVADLEEAVGHERAQELRAEAFDTFVRRMKQSLTRGVFRFEGQWKLYRYVQIGFFGRPAVKANGEATRVGPRVYLERLYRFVRKDEVELCAREQEIDQIATDVPNDTVELLDEYGQVTEKIQRLTTTQRSLLDERYVRGRTVADIARTQGREYDAVHSEIRRILEKLR